MAGPLQTSLTRRQRLNRAADNHNGEALQFHAPVDSAESSISLPREPRRTHVLRIVTLTIIATVIAVVGAYAWLLLRDAEVYRFENEYRSTVEFLEREMALTLKDMEDTAFLIANDIVLPRGVRKAITGLQAKGGYSLQLAKATTGSVIAFVAQEERQLFEEWARNSSGSLLSREDEAVTDARSRMVGASRFKYGISGISGVTFPNGTVTNIYFPNVTEGACGPGIPGFPASTYAPVIQGFPWNLTAASFLVDACDLSDRRDTLLRVAQEKRAGSTGLTILFSDALQGILRPITVLASPVFSATEVDPSREVTGVLSTSFIWSDLLARTLSAEVGNTIDIVLRSPARNFQYADIGATAPIDTSAFTFRVENSGVKALGWGDRHEVLTDSDTAYESVISVSLGFTSFTVTVYPTNHMFASYHTDLPRKAVIGSVLLITAIATLFALYDWVSKRHTRDLYIQNAIANSQFSVAREAMRSRHAFVSMVSHEIRSPASAIVGALDVLLTNNPTPFQKDFLDTIRIGSAQILSLVEDALAVGLEGEGRFRLNAVPVDIRRDVVEQNWANIQLQRRFADKLRKIRMELEVAPDVPDKGVMDPHRVAQVICNLVGNAIRFVPEGTGFVKMTVSFSHDDDLLVISVADNGVGLTREHMNRLFLPFSQAEGEVTKQKFGGTGLGLVVSRDIARAMGGDLTVESPGLGQGATFTATMQVGDLALLRHGYTSSSSITSGSAVASAAGSALTRSGAEAPSVEGSVLAANGTPARALGGSGASDGGSPEERDARLSSAGVTLPGAVQVTIIEADDSGGDDDDPLFHDPLAERESFWTDLAIVAQAASGGRRTATGSRLRDGRRASVPRSSEGGDPRASAAASGPTTLSATVSVHTSGTLGSGGTTASAASSCAAGGATTASSASAPGHRVRIVAAEDDPLVRRVLTMTLALTGMECVGLYPDGVALGAVLARKPARPALPSPRPSSSLNRPRAASNTSPDLTSPACFFHQERDPAAADCVLLDSNMGGGDRDGLPTIKRLLRMYRALALPPPVVVVLSGDSDFAAQQAFLDAGASKVMLKPASLAELKQLRLFVLQRLSAREPRDSQASLAPVPRLSNVPSAGRDLRGRA